MANLRMTRRESLRLRPDPRRVITKPFVPREEMLASGSTRPHVVLGRIMAMHADEVVRTLDDTRALFAGRHRDLESIFDHGFDSVRSDVARHAIEVAHRSGRRLDIAGIIQDADYFAAEVEPHLHDGRVRYLGPVTASERSKVLGGASALLHLVDFDEPFGYSVVEAMACGTPVIAHRRGSMPELIENGRTGFLVTGIDEAVVACAEVAALDRQAIRRLALTRFDAAAMIDRYVEVYRAITGNER